MEKVHKVLMYVFASWLLFMNLEGGWISPPASVELNSMQAIVNENSNGNSIIAWLDSASNNILTSIYDPDTLTFGPHEFLVANSQIISGNTGFSVSVNNKGEAIAVWAQTGLTPSLHYSIHTETGWKDQGTLFTANLGDNIDGLQLMNDQNGNAIACFLQISGGTTELKAAFFNGVSWQIQTLESTSAPFAGLDLILNNAGEGAIFWALGNFLTTFTVKAANFSTSTQTFQPTTTLYSVNGGLFFEFANSISNNGKIIASWKIFPFGLFTAIYDNGWMPFVTLIAPPNGLFLDSESFSSSINDQGDAAVAYSYHEGINSILVASYHEGIWTTQIVATSSSSNFATPQVALDAFSDGIVAWRASSDPALTSSALEIATRITLNGDWSNPALFFAQGTLGNAVGPFKIMINNKNNVYLVWGNIDPQTGLFLKINISFGFDLFIPFSPSNFRGKRVNDHFATQKDLINVLKWNPGKNSLITRYYLYRNGKLIAKIPAHGPYRYHDHNRHPRQKDTYELWSTIEGQFQSIPRILVIP